MKLAEYNPLHAGLMCAFVGPPGSGKSTLAKSASVLGKGCVLFSPSREAVTYAGMPDWEGEVLEETEWEPTANSFKATAYTRTLGALRGLKARKDIRVVVCDTLSRQLGYAYNHAIAPHGTDDFVKLGNNKFSVWATVKAKSVELCDALEALRATGKHVIALLHQDVKEIEGAGVGVNVTDTQGKRRIEWDQGKVPEVMGSFRDTIAGRFDLFGFMERTTENGKTRYEIQVRPSQRAWAKSAIDCFTTDRIPADFPSIVETIKTHLTKPQLKVVA